MTEFSQGPALWQAIAALIIFVAAYICILIEKWDRMYTALGGAILMLLLGIVPIGKALTTYANWHVLLFLVSLFVIAGLFQKTGLIAFAASKIIRVFRLQPFTILIGLSVLAAVSSALLNALLAIAVIVPILLKTTKMMKLSPVPFLISVLLSANLGGAATLMGNWSNRLIGAAEHITTGEMLIKIGPLVILMLAIVYLTMWFLYGRKMIIPETYKREVLSLQPETYLTEDRVQFIGGSAIAGATLLAFLLQGILGWQASYIAAGGAIALIALNYQDLIQLFKKRDYRSFWSGVLETQGLFVLGLFIMVGGLTYAGISGFIAVRGLELSQGSMSFLSMLLLWLTGFGSSVVDYVPYTAAMIPVVDHIGTEMKSFSQASIQPLWWSIIIGTAIGSGVTLFGSISSMYAAALAEQEGGGLNPRNYFMIAGPISLVLFIVATIYFKLFLL
ncbi:SLC13 family permease [Paenibacillus chondroitinus]|uniref:SLC13 family permease n=1 Tax=Paenibacillus chondroitinus TaxID=59842 RepID=A0ABU6DAR3_9BACL|nr:MULTISPECIES: SLC13 family permease [Paenibacillus]MCY9661076.1 SLC13 family permease [Paenibacillus anseongense]MEB4794803.1 SLC13 family permease [Paenibacillus chondroitinus]